MLGVGWDEGGLDLDEVHRLTLDLEPPPALETPRRPRAARSQREAEQRDDADRDHADHRERKRCADAAGRMLTHQLSVSGDPIDEREQRKEQNGMTPPFDDGVSMRSQRKEDIGRSPAYLVGVTTERISGIAPMAHALPKGMLGDRKEALK